MTLTRRRFTQIAAMAAAAPRDLLHGQQAPADFSLTIGPCIVDASPKHQIKTIGYSGQVPGPLLRMRQGRPVTVDVTNNSPDPEIVHWHGLFLPPEVDGAMEEGSPMIAPGASTRLRFTPEPAGFRWFHTHTSAGKDFQKAQYGGQHGFLLIEPLDNPARYDDEVFLALHDWNGQDMGGDDGSMNPVYEVSTINGKMLGFGAPIRVKAGSRVLFHILNSSPTEQHWIVLAGHTFRVIALDGNPVPTPSDVPMLRLAPAERVSSIVEMNNSGVWVLGEVQKHVQAAGMGIVVEYANATAKPVWNQPNELVWNYRQFAATGDTQASGADVIRIPLVMDSKFMGHGAEEQWRINGKSYPHTDEPLLTQGQRYRLILKNQSMDDHPLHLHRHTFEVRQVADSGEIHGLHKDVLLVPAKTSAEIEFTADHPGRTLFHCHQQNHMDRGFMMVFRYA